MLMVNGVGRVAKIHKFSPKGENGNQFASITFTLACARGKDKNNKELTDFVFCRLNGTSAENFNKFATEKDGTGKLISRLLFVSGHLVTYQKERPIQIEEDENIGLPPETIAKYKLTKEDSIIKPHLTIKSSVNQNNFMLVCNYFQLLDSKKTEGTSSSSTGSNMTVSYGNNTVNTKTQSDKSSTKSSKKPTDDEPVDFNDMDFSDDNMNPLDEGNIPF